MIGTGRNVAIEFAVGTLISQDRKLSFEFDRELIETKPTGPATLTKINMKPVGEDGVDIAPVQTIEQRAGVPMLQLDDEAEAAAETADDKAPTEEPEQNEPEVVATPSVATPSGLSISTSKPDLTMEEEFKMTEEIFGASLSPSMQDAYKRHMKDLKNKIAEEQQHLNTVSAELT